MNFKALINIDSPIIPGLSIGNININTHKNEIFKFLQSSFAYGDNDVNVKLEGYTNLIIVIYNAIQINYSFLSDSIVMISAEKNYTGKFDDRIHVNSKIGDIIQSYPNYLINVRRDYTMELENIEGLIFDLPKPTDEIKFILNESISKISVFPRNDDCT